MLLLASINISQKLFRNSLLELRLFVVYFSQVTISCEIHTHLLSLRSNAPSRESSAPQTVSIHFFVLCVVFCTALGGSIVARNKTKQDFNSFFPGESIHHSCNFKCSGPSTVVVFPASHQMLKNLPILTICVLFLVPH